MVYGFGAAEVAREAAREHGAVAMRIGDKAARAVKAKAQEEAQQVAAAPAAQQVAKAPVVQPVVKASVDPAPPLPPPSASPAAGPVPVAKSYVEVASKAVQGKAEAKPAQPVKSSSSGAKPGYVPVPKAAVPGGSAAPASVPKSYSSGAAPASGRFVIAEPGSAEAKAAAASAKQMGDKYKLTSAAVGAMNVSTVKTAIRDRLLPVVTTYLDGKGYLLSDGGKY